MNFNNLIQANNIQKVSLADMVLAMGEKEMYRENIYDIWTRIRHIRQLHKLFDSELQNVVPDEGILLGCVNYINFLLGSYKRKSLPAYVDYIIVNELGSITPNSFFDAPRFIDLRDVTPKSYAGQGKKTVTVKADESGLEFKTAIGGGGQPIEIWNQEDADAGDYDIDVFVSHDGKIWKSLINNNTVEPSLDATDEWEAQSVEDMTGGILTKDITSTVAFGATPAGTLFPIGMSFTEYVEKKETLNNVVLIAPTFSLSQNAGNFREIGQETDVLLTFNFNRGSITLNGNYQNPRAGAATGYVIYGSTTGNTLTVSNYEVQQGINSFTGTVSYAQGAQPIDVNGQPFGTPLPAGTSPVQTASFEGVYPLYGSTSTITTATKQPLVSMLSANNVQINLVAETGGNKQFFDIPNAWLSSRPITDVRYFDALTGQFTINGKLSDFAQTPINHTIQGNVIDYTRFTNTSPNRGALPIQLVF